MTTSPARKSLRLSASVRSCGRRSLSESSTTRPTTPSCNGARRCRSPAWRSTTAKAIPAFLKGLDRLDRCQRAAKVSRVYDDEARRRLFDKINRVAANLGYDHARTAADGAPESADLEDAAGNEEEKEKMAWGVAASL